MEDFSREELQKIEQRAVGMANGQINSFWQRAYLNLADACDRLDAMTARTQDRNGMETVNDQEQSKKEEVSGIAIERRIGDDHKCPRCGEISRILVKKA